MNTDELLAKKESQIQTANASSLNIFAPGNRGILFDILIFLINLLLMQYLTVYFTDLGRQAFAGNRLAQIAMFFLLALVFLMQPIGANFKRWQFHQRRRAGRRRKKSADGYIFNFADSVILALIFNPITFFCILIFNTMFIISFLNDLIIGRNTRNDDSMVVVFVLVGFLVSVAHSLAVYRYFTSPTKEPRPKILYSPQSGIIGDIGLFINIFIFQVLWNTIGQIPSTNISTVGDFWIRAFFLTAMSLLIYLPARFLYLGEDYKKPLAWLTILLAISPLIIRFLSS